MRTFAFETKPPHKKGHKKVSPDVTLAFDGEQKLKAHKDRNKDGRQEFFGTAGESTAEANGWYRQAGKGVENYC